MNRQQFYQYLASPENLNEDSLSNLMEVMAEYPYFQAARMLLVKNMALLDHIRYNQELKIAAAHIPDRRKLYFMIHEPAKPKVVLPFQEKPVELVVSAPVLTEEVVKEEPKVQSVSFADYFDVPDTLESPTGEIIQFSMPAEIIEENPDQMVLPSADLLDYELQETKGYLLEDEETDDFDASQNRSFSDWLKALHHQSVKPKAETPPPKNKNRQMDIIESFLKQGDKKIVPQAKTTDQRDVAEDSLRESEDLMTETLANIHIKQKHYHKAITIFEKLSLKYPEKNIYFASRIKELESLINNQ